MNRVKHCSVLIFHRNQIIEREGDFMSACWLVGIIGKLFLKHCHQRRLMATLQVIVLTVLSQQLARYSTSGCFYPPSTKSWYCLVNILILQSSGVITLTRTLSPRKKRIWWSNYLIVVKSTKKMSPLLILSASHKNSF